MAMIDKEKLYDALRKMGPKYVKKQYRNRWTPERPTTGYCYIVAEVVYHYLAPKGSKPHVVRMNGDETHWCIVLPDGQIVDLTSDQYDEPVPYDKGRPHAFMTPRISKKGRILAKLLGLDD